MLDRVLVLDALDRIHLPRLLTLLFTCYLLHICDNALAGLFGPVCSCACQFLHLVLLMSYLCICNKLRTVCFKPMVA